MGIKYLSSKAEWKKLVDYLINEEIIGFDTEFDGVDFNAGDNCVGTSVLDVFSVAVFDGGFHPRGYSTAVGYVLPKEALETCRPILESEKISKVAHNGVVDVHTCWNSGVDVLSLFDTLSMFRWLYPGRKQYGLDVLSREFLDDSKFIKFKELCSEPVLVEKEIEVKNCICGESGCRKRKLPVHQKFITKEIELVERGTRRVDISTITPGSPKWNQKVEYAGQDAVLALCLYDYAVRRLKKMTYENPFRLKKSTLA